MQAALDFSSVADTPGCATSLASTAAMERALAHAQAPSDGRISNTHGTASGARAVGGAPVASAAGPQLAVVHADERAHELTLHVRGFPLGLMNGLRRIVMAEVPCFAFHDVVEQENTGALQTERVRDRLALVPVAVPGVDMLEAERLYRQGDGAARKKLALRFVLRDKCLAQADCSPGCTFRQTVAASLQWMPRTAGESTRAPALRPRPVHPGMPVTNLPLGSRLCLYVLCIPGTGALHSKWSPVCPCTCITARPQAMCAPDRDLGAEAPALALASASATGAADSSGSGTEEDEGVLFALETTGALTPAETLNYGVRVFQQKIDALLAAFGGP